MREGPKLFCNEPLTWNCTVKPIQTLIAIHKESLLLKRYNRKEKIILMAESCNMCSRVVVFKSLLLLQFSRYCSQIFTQSKPNCWEERQGFTFWHFSILWFLIDFQKLLLYRVPKTPIFFTQKNLFKIPKAKIPKSKTLALCPIGSWGLCKNLRAVAWKL